MLDYSKYKKRVIIFRDAGKAAEYIAERLNEAGIIVHRYDAVNSNSIYLKFDYGISNSLRISDHRGRAFREYKYNLQLDGNGKTKTMYGGNPRLIYGMDSVDRLIEDIIASRATSIRKQGEDEYKSKVKSAKSRSKSNRNRGFWRKAYKV